MLDLSKIESGKMEMKSCAVDVVDVGRRSVTAFSALAASKGIGLTFTAFPETMPLFWVDKIHLRQIW